MLLIKAMLYLQDRGFLVECSDIVGPAGRFYKVSDAVNQDVPPIWILPRGICSLADLKDQEEGNQDVYSPNNSNQTNLGFDS